MTTAPKKFAYKRLTGLFAKKNDDGSEFWSGQLEDGRPVSMRVNTFATEAKHPKFNLAVKEGEKWERLTGLFEKTNDYGTWYSGQLEDKRYVKVSAPKETGEGKPALVLYVEDTES